MLLYVRSSNNSDLGVKTRACSSLSLDENSSGFRLPGPQQSVYTMAANAVLRLIDRRNRAVVRSEPTLRRPIGEWSLPAVRTAKAVHQRVVSAAEPYVFERLERAQAFALVAAVSESLGPFIAAGVLVGPDGSGPPEVTGGVDANPVAPGLHADVTAQLRPWCQLVSVRVALRGGAQPTLELPA